MIDHVLVVHGGELAQDVAEQFVEQKPNNDQCSACKCTLRCASDKPKTLVDAAGSGTGAGTSTVVVVFIMQTIENASPTEQGGVCTRYFNRKSHPSDLLSSSSSSSSSSSFHYAVLGLGDSNLLLDRQTTSAKDCNQVAQQLDKRLEQLGATRFVPLRLADERTGLQVEVDPWIQSFWDKVVLENKQ